MSLTMERDRVKETKAINFAGLKGIHLRTFDFLGCLPIYEISCKNK